MKSVFKKARVNPEPFRVGEDVEIQKETKRLCGEAQQRAQLIVQQAEVNAKNIQKSVYEQAQRKAFQEAQRNLEKEKQTLIKKAQAEFQRVMGSFESEILKLVIEVCKKVCRTEISQDKEKVMQMIKESIKKFEGTDRLLVRLNPTDIEDLQGKINEGHVDVAHLELKADPALEKGDFIMEGEGAVIDGRIGHQLEQVKDDLSDVK